MPTPSRKRILVIKLKQPGDVLVSTPVIAALKAAWPECHLTYLVPKGTEDMVSGHPGLDGLLVVDRRGATWGQTWRFIRDLRRQRFDLVLELSGGDRGAIYSFLTGARERLGFAHPRQPFWQRHGCFTRLLPRPPVKMHLVDQNLAAVRALGIEPVNPRLQFFWDAAVEQKVRERLASLGLAEKPFVVMHPGAGWRFKCWTPSGYARVIEFFQDQWGLPTVLTGTRRRARAGTAGRGASGVPGRAHRSIRPPEPEGTWGAHRQSPPVLRDGQRPHAPGRGGEHPGGGALRPQRGVQLGPLGRRPPGDPKGLGLRPLRPGWL